MSTIDEASGAVGGNAESAHELADRIAQSKSVLESLSGAFAGLGANDKQGEADACTGEAETLTAQANALADALDALRSRIEGLRGLLNTRDTAATQTSSPTTSPPARRIEGFNSKRAHPKAIEAVKRAGYPRNAEGRTSARAFVYDSNGRQLNDEPLKAYPRGQTPARPELKEPWASSEELTTTWHVEGDAAAMIRNGNLQDAAFYLNVPLCGSRQGASEWPDPKGCAENFRHILPEGTRAWVHVVGEGRVPFIQKIEGTGEGLKE